MARKNHSVTRLSFHLQIHIWNWSGSLRSTSWKKLSQSQSFVRPTRPTPRCTSNTLEVGSRTQWAVASRCKKTQPANKLKVGSLTSKLSSISLSSSNKKNLNITSHSKNKRRKPLRKKIPSSCNSKMIMQIVNLRLFLKTVRRCFKQMARLQPKAFHNCLTLLIRSPWQASKFRTQWTVKAHVLRCPHKPPKSSHQTTKQKWKDSS